MFGKSTFSAILCGLFLAVASAPAQAAQTWDWSCWCWRDSGPALITASNGAKYTTLTETVPYTGQTHLVLVMNKAFFPKKLYASYGDRILFVNKSSYTVKVASSNSTWTSASMGYEAAYMLLVQSGVNTGFTASQTSCSYYCSTPSGEFTISALPSQVNYWEDTLTTTQMLPLFEIPSNLLSTTLTWVANLQTLNGITKLVTSAI